MSNNTTKAEKLFKKTLAKHNKLIKNENPKKSGIFYLFGLKPSISKKLKEIIDDYSKVLEISPKQKSIFLNRGVAKTSLAKIYMEENREDEALELFDSSVNDFGRVLYFDDRNIGAYMYSTVSNYKIYEIHKQKSDYYSMRRFLLYVMEDYNSLEKIVDRDKVQSIIAEKALVEFDLAEVYLLVGNRDKALEHFQNSIDNYLQNIDRDAIFNISLSYSKIASIYKERKEYHLAGISLEESNKYYIKLLDYSFEDSSFTKASILYDISLNMGEMGDILSSLEDYDSAIETYNEATQYLKKSLSLNPFNKESSINLASIQIAIAKNYLFLGKNREAITLYHNTIDSSLLQISHFNDVISLNILAVAHTELADIYRYEMIEKQDESLMDKAKAFYIDSEKYYNQALKIDKNDAPTYVNLAGNYSQIGMFYIYIKENRNAIEVSQKSLDMLFQALEIDKSLNLTTNIDAVKLNISEAYKRENQADKALGILENGLDSRDSKNRASLLAEIGRLYYDRGVTDKTIDFFDKAFNNYLKKLKSHPDNLLHLENFSTLLESILQISQNSNYVEKALWCNQKIIDIYDEYFIDIGFEDDSFSMTQKMSTALERLLDVYIISDKRADTSLVEALERVKAKRLKQLIVANRIESEDIEFKILKSKLDRVKRDITKESLDMFNIEKQERLYEEFQDYSQQLSKLLNLEQDELNIYEILKPKTVVVYPIYNSQKLTVITVEKKDELEINISQIVIKEDIRFSDYLFFIKYIEESINNDKFLDKEYLKIIDDIKIDKRIKQEILKIDKDEFIEDYKYEIVQIALSHIKDKIIKSIPKGIEKILFAPFGDLNLIPLHAISTGEDKYLIEDYEISYIASLSLMKKIELNPKTDRVTSKDNLIVSMKGLHDEAEKLLNIIEGVHLKEIEIDEFKEYIKDKNFNILHFSTHGSASLDYPLDSHLEFNKTNLHLLEIFGLNINANLVNISACETYLSKLKGADEVLAFERAFLIAGAKSVISTFSKVDIMRTEDFMKIFYENIKEYGFISKSFQKASIEDIENGSMEWSLFRLMGTY